MVPLRGKFAISDDWNLPAGGNFPMGAIEEEMRGSCVFLNGTF
jgi:hypothetical protein